MWNCELDHEVEWSDLDGNAHLNNVAAFRLFQDTRSRILQPLRVHAMAQGCTLVVAHVELDFKASAGLGDVLTSRTRLVEVTEEGKTFRIVYEAWCRERLVVRGHCVCALQGPGGKAVALRSVQGAVDCLNRARQASVVQRLSKL